MGRRDDITPLGDALRQFLGNSPLADGVRQQEAVLRWPDIVGEEIARHCQAISLHEGLLVVRVSSAVWAQELSLLRPRILAACAQELGTGVVREIRVHSRSESAG